MTEPVASLFLSFLPSNPGFSIEPLEILFARAGIELAGGDPTRVHFAFASLDGGPPRNLPPGSGACAIISSARQQAKHECFWTMWPNIRFNWRKGSTSTSSIP